MKRSKECGPWKRIRGVRSSTLSRKCRIHGQHIWIWAYSSRGEHLKAMCSVSGPETDGVPAFGRDLWLPNMKPGRYPLRECMKLARKVAREQAGK